MNGRHIYVAQCTKGEEMKCRRMAEEEMKESLERSFQSYGKPLETATLFKYLRRVLTAGDDE